MPNIRHNKTLARGIILGGTILAGLGIWTSVAHASLPAPSSPAPIISGAPSPNSNFSQNDSFLNQPAVQNGLSTGQQQYPLQPAPATAPRLRTRGS